MSIKLLSFSDFRYQRKNLYNPLSYAKLAIIINPTNICNYHQYGKFTF